MAFITFERKIPEFLIVGNSAVSITEMQYKCGNSSLKWKYNDGDYLIFNTDIGYVSSEENSKDNRVSAFAMYIFGITGTGHLDIEFLKKGISCCNFKVNLGFNGWRHIAAVFDRDMNGTAVKDMDSFKITAHGDGEILLDEIVTSVMIGARYIMASEQLPYIDNKVIPIERHLKLRNDCNPDIVDSAAIRRIKERYGKYIIDEYDHNKTAEELIACAQEYKIEENQYGTVGKRIEHAHQRGYVSGTVGAAHEYATLRNTTDLMCDIAITYKKTGSKELLKNYVLLLKHIMNQGVAYGSTLGTHMILDYSLRPFYFSLAVMSCEEEIKPFLKDLELALRWFTHIEARGFMEGHDMQAATTDDFFNLAPGIMTMSLMMEDDTKTAWALKTLSLWLDFNMKFSDGLTDMFKDDGCIFHHGGHYPAYGSGALVGIAPILYALGDSDYGISEESRQNMRKVMLSLRFQSAGRMYPVAFSGRHPLRRWGLDLIGYKYFALYMLQFGDDEMAKVYLRLSNQQEGHPDKNEQTIIKAEDIPQGNQSFPMACANVHRRDDWMLVTKGFSKYLWGNESYLDANLYGRYISNGAIELYNDVTYCSERYTYEGFDWNCFSGTTSVKLPLKQLRSQIYNLDDKSGFEEMLISDQSFAGSNTLENNGMFSVIVTGHPKYNDTFKAYKSVFMYDDFVLAMGSNITDLSGFETVTTLFQNKVLDGDEQAHKEKDRIYDNRGNVYYLFDECDVEVTQKLQYSRNSVNDEPTEGIFATATIHHGKCPSNESYIYGIGIKGAQMPDVEIIRQDDKAHIVRINDILYMSIFEPGIYENIQVSIPVMVMRKKIDEKSEVVSVCNPDLGLYEYDSTQYDENGNRREVSIYSRTWLTNPVGTKDAVLSIDGKKFKLCMRGGDIIKLTL